MDPNVLPEDFREFLQFLEETESRYLLIGGYAVGYHGYPRTTADMDIWISDDPSNAERVLLALRKFGLETPDLNSGVLIEKGNILRMGVPPMRIEILNEIDGVAFADCYQKRVRAEVDGLQINLIQKEDLLLNKRASGRFKDLDDIEHLEP